MAALTLRLPAARAPTTSPSQAPRRVLRPDRSDASWVSSRSRSPASSWSCWRSGWSSINTRAGARGSRCCSSPASRSTPGQPGYRPGRVFRPISADW